MTLDHVRPSPDLFPKKPRPKVPGNRMGMIPIKDDPSYSDPFRYAVTNWRVSFDPQTQSIRIEELDGSGTISARSLRLAVADKFPESTGRDSDRPCLWVIAQIFKAAEKIMTQNA